MDSIYLSLVSQKRTPLNRQCHLDKDDIVMRILLQRIDNTFIRYFSIPKSIQRNKFA